MPAQVRIPAEPISRQAELKGWLAARVPSFTDLARDLGMRKQDLTDVIAGRKTAPRLVKALLDAGAPRELLPEPTGGWEKIVGDSENHGASVENFPQKDNRFSKHETRQDEAA